MNPWRIAICTIAGVALTLAVTVGSALVSDFSTKPRQVQELTVGDRALLIAEYQSRYAHRFCVVEINKEHLPLYKWQVNEVRTKPLPTWASIERFPDRRNEGLESSVVDEAHGWPVKAMSCRIVAKYSPMQGKGVAQSEFGGWQLAPVLPPRDWGTVYRAIPDHVLIGGFAVNTAFYALLIWLTMLAYTFLRRRNRRGRCPACAYDLRGNLAAGCSECGWNRQAGTG